MDYKKKYEKALDNFKKIKAANKDNKELVDFIEYEYPELKESDDDKIRKALITYIEYNVSVILGWSKDKLIAWLEKQGEQKPADNDIKEALRTEYEKGRADAIAEMQDWSEEDEEHYERCLNIMRLSLDIKPYPYYKDYLWLKSIKERMKGE